MGPQSLPHKVHFQQIPLQSVAIELPYVPLGTQLTAKLLLPILLTKHHDVEQPLVKHLKQPLSATIMRVPLYAPRIKPPMQQAHRK